LLFCLCCCSCSWLTPAAAALAQKQELLRKSKSVASGKKKKINSNLTDLGSSENTYSLWFNFIKLNLLHIVTSVLTKLRDITFDGDGLDSLFELENLRDTLLSSLDPYLIIQVQKRGITINQNTRTGIVVLASAKAAEHKQAFTLNIFER
jgi:hypothetical protein